MQDGRVGWCDSAPRVFAEHGWRETQPLPLWKPWQKADLFLISVKLRLQKGHR
jgi:hypothetical protein